MPINYNISYILYFKSKKSNIDPKKSNISPKTLEKFFILNQNSCAMVNFMLDNLGHKVAKYLAFSLEIAV